MAEFVRMPQKGLTEESALLSQWHVQEGDAVKPGQLLFALETGKAVFDVESEVSGTVLQCIGNEGDEIAVKAVVMVIGEPGETYELKEASPGSPDAPQSPETEKKDKIPLPEPKEESSVSGKKIRISPRARRLAQKHSLSYEGITGSGPGGRILVEDIDALLSTTRTGDERQSTTVASQMVESIPVSAMRATIADRLSQSFFSAPHIFMRTAVEMDHLLRMRKKIASETGNKISFNAFIIKLVAETLKRHPRINSSWQGSTIQLYPYSDIALAVALPDGLITPVVRDCGNKSINQIETELSGLIEKAKSGKLLPEEYSNQTFTVSNLGGYGIEEFSAIINPPASSILALGSAVKEPVVGENDTIEIKTRMRMTLSCDHRPIDGAVGAAFLNDLTKSMQEPLRALL